MWLSEGFATYLTHMFVEHVEGRDAFVAGLRRDRDRVAAAEKKTPDTPIVHRNISDMSRVLNTFVYQKAGWVLHMLRAESRRREVPCVDSRGTSPLPERHRVHR